MGDGVYWVDVDEINFLLSPMGTSAIQSFCDIIYCANETIQIERIDITSQKFTTKGNKHDPKWHSSEKQHKKSSKINVCCSVKNREKRLPYLSVRETEMLQASKLPNKKEP